MPLDASALGAYGDRAERVSADVQALLDTDVFSDFTVAVKSSPQVSLRLVTIEGTVFACSEDDVVDIPVGLVLKPDYPASAPYCRLVIPPGQRVVPGHPAVAPSGVIVAAAVKYLAGWREAGDASKSLTEILLSIADVCGDLLPFEDAPQQQAVPAPPAAAAVVSALPPSPPPPSEPVQPAPEGPAEDVPAEEARATPIGPAETSPAEPALEPAPDAPSPAEPVPAAPEPDMGGGAVEASATPEMGHDDSAALAMLGLDPVPVPAENSAVPDAEGADEVAEVALEADAGAEDCAALMMLGLEDPIPAAAEEPALPGDLVAQPEHVEGVAEGGGVQEVGAAADDAALGFADPISVPAEEPALHDEVAAAQPVVVQAAATDDAALAMLGLGDPIPGAAEPALHDDAQPEVAHQTATADDDALMMLGLHGAPEVPLVTATEAPVPEDVPGDVAPREEAADGPAALDAPPVDDLMARLAALQVPSALPKPPAAVEDDDAVDLAMLGLADPDGVDAGSPSDGPPAEGGAPPAMDALLKQLNALTVPSVLPSLPVQSADGGAAPPQPASRYIIDTRILERGVDDDGHTDDTPGPAEDAAVQPPTDAALFMGCAVVPVTPQPLGDPAALAATVPDAAPAVDEASADAGVAFDVPDAALFMGATAAPSVPVDEPADLAAPAEAVGGAALAASQAPLTQTPEAPATELPKASPGVTPAAMGADPDPLGLFGPVAEPAASAQPVHCDPAAQLPPLPLRMEVPPAVDDFFAELAGAGTPRNPAPAPQAGPPVREQCRATFHEVYPPCVGAEDATPEGQETRRQLVEVIGERLARDMAILKQSAEVRVGRLVSSKEALEMSKENVRQITSMLKERRKLLAESLPAIEQALQDALKAETSAQEFVDAPGSVFLDLIKPDQPLQEQALENTALDKALEDTMYALESGLKRGVLEPPEFQRSIMDVSRRVFECRVVRNKIARRTAAAAVGAAGSRPSPAGVQPYPAANANVVPAPMDAMGALFGASATSPPSMEAPAAKRQRDIEALADEFPDLEVNIVADVYNNTGHSASVTRDRLRELM
eukprot:TRINITY_DN8913_c0_g2_i2.p1 TRINITY_DN8913_c0_g2~~TRINITY_DN8913_c0_g2_i2.p1  ORF type:complete len:1066 (+),score=299.32 TRINITY_DN8913_c0_g2_i2:81-3278(+)